MMHRYSATRRTMGALGVVALVALGSCSSDKSSGSATTGAAGTTPAAATPAPSASTAESTATSTEGSAETSTAGSTDSSTASSIEETTEASTDSSTGETDAPTASSAADTTVVVDDTVGDVRGFDGTTITVAGIGIKGQLPGVEFGVRARIKRFNDTNEIPGVKIEYTEYVDDGLDRATALSQTRRLVTDTKIFALVGDSSPVNPADYLAEEHVPYFGLGYDDSYCAADTTTEMWAFGTLGCLTPTDPAVIADTAGTAYEYISKELGKAAPTVAIFGQDTEGGKNTTRFQGVAYKGAGFDVIFEDGIVPLPPVTDYSPYVQQLMVSDDGHAPDVITCLLAVDCIPMYAQLQAVGFKGEFYHNLYSDALVAPMKGSIVNSPFHNLADPNPVVEQISADIAAVKPDQALETGSAQGYMSADMFITALKIAVEQGLSGITPENIEKVASNMTWEIKDFAGPTTFPTNFVSSAACRSILRSNGTTWQTLVPYGCSVKTYPVK